MKKKKKYNYTMKTGRPTKYSDEMIKKAEQYIKNCKDEIKQIISGMNEKSGNEFYKDKLIVNIPTAEGLSLYLDVSRKTLYTWAEEHDEFSHILDRMNAVQASRVINKAMSGDYNPLIAKLLLGKHGYKDQVGLSGEEEGSPVKIQVGVKTVIDKIYGGKSN